MAYLVLVRHGESEWNVKGIWTGWTDVDLTDKGREEAKKAGEEIKTKNIRFDAAYTTDLKRASNTLQIIKEILGLQSLPTTVAKELKERDYGDLTGKDKWKLKEEYGEEQWMKWRRSWNDPVPGGETLEDVYNRAVPYYKSHILPLLKEGKNIIIAAHGNSLRALIKELENVSNDDIAKLEFGTGAVYIYQIDENGKISNKEVIASKPAQ